ncbi:drug/metabolite transporter (DMT)-like permease [Parabacteroides sp. PF5-5]|uniref:DMT family transporter n=1 Tax=unclassified Parabacteroides TaxID=2649774 RepID=UPI002474521E|nr:MULTISPECIES: DMT family transporter [unclassified Parabacteroides]MDH6305949.1 drug/metabolite transporter (DMT)-like permease [Parabacteroides sp. PH5-39]MDH6317205.1 drug/metabolite transporter (DMT)-like permease [Parabacteroides sp. PF5-13]MDH6320661.1 drug/metabolite transporter (DMT)-like permease [Parabacteroides sp. PH5-13]MDH6324418.1 drug/metabolite transporter (DMT)-like permease [Parabacteroides sp. PH5-8]MDH6328390.1 drug/metabolite transporter (DMT)-like permease [Parabactero
MRQAFIKLHISILLAGFTGIFGKIITLNEGLLVWYRMLITAIIMLLVLFTPPNPLKGGLEKRPSFPPFRGSGGESGGGMSFRMFGVGALLALHWVFFFGSIKASNVSIGVICFALTGFFTALLEPLMNKRRISLKEVAFSLITLLGILLIFHFDARYRTGILLGIVSALLAALFTITNKQLGKEYPSSVMLLYEMIGGFLLLSFLMPFYLYFFPTESIIPTGKDFLYLLVFSVFCTALLYLLQIDVLKTISAFTVNLSYNLEPVYSIIIAMLFLGEAKELNLYFYIGLGLIILSVLLQSWNVWRTSQPIASI